MKLCKLKDVKKYFMMPEVHQNSRWRDPRDNKAYKQLLGGGVSFCFYLKEEMREKLSLTKWQIQVQNR